MAALPIMVLLSCSFAGLAQSVNIQSARLSPEGSLKSGELVLRKRHVEEESIICAEDEYSHPDSQHCCKKCYSGFRKVADCPAKDKITECEPCPKGHFLEKPNSSRRCRLCFQCIPSLGQITKSNCTQSKNTECGCVSGQFKVMEGESFRCQNCSQCENGKVIHQCFNFTDTLCSCNFGFFFDKAVRQCLACETCADAECRDHCPPTDTVKSEPPRNTIVLSVLPSVGMLVVLVILGVYIIRKRRSTTSTQKLITVTGLPEQETSPVEFTETTEIQIGKIIHPHVETNLQLATPSLTQITMPLLQQPDITLDARAQQFQNPAELYNVIDNIPLNRWREFVRRLGLSDNDIDGCEYQNTRRFRDAQYDMLMIWSQNVGPLGATKEAVIGVLKEMSLMGPVEAILDVQ